LAGDIPSLISRSPRESQRSFPVSAACRDRRSAKSQEWGESAANQQIQRVASETRLARQAELQGDFVARS